MHGPKHNIQKVCPGLQPAFHRKLVKDASYADSKIGIKEHDIVNRRLGNKDLILGDTENQSIS